MRKEVTLQALGRRQRAPYTDFIRPPASNTVSGPGNVIVVPGSGSPGQCAGGEPGLPTPLCPPTVVDQDFAYVGGGSGGSGFLDEDGYLIASFTWDSITGPLTGPLHPPDPSGLGIHWPGGIRASGECWADPFRFMGASAGSSGLVHWVRPGAAWRIGATIILHNETGDAYWENVTNYNYVAWLDFLGTSGAYPTLSYPIINARYHNAGCIDQQPTVSALLPAGYYAARIRFRYRLGGWAYHAIITATPPGYVVLPVGCPDPGPQPPGTYSESLINSGGGIYTSRATNLTRFTEVYFDGALVIEGIDYIAIGYTIIPLVEPYPTIIDVVYVV
jgi:hypothetical protein